MALVAKKICFVHILTVVHTQCVGQLAGLYTIFAQSNAVAAVYFINQLCAASIQEQHLSNLVKNLL